MRSPQKHMFESFSRNPDLMGSELHMGTHIPDTEMSPSEVYRQDTGVGNPTSYTHSMLGK